jgi:hypothetical protein
MVVAAEEEGKAFLVSPDGLRVQARHRHCLLQPCCLTQPLLDGEAQAQPRCADSWQGKCLKYVNNLR